MPGGKIGGRKVLLESGDQRDEVLVVRAGELLIHGLRGLDPEGLVHFGDGHAELGELLEIFLLRVADEVGLPLAGFGGGLRNSLDLLGGELLGVILHVHDENGGAVDVAVKRHVVADLIDAVGKN